MDLCFWRRRPTLLAPTHADLRIGDLVRLTLRPSVVANLLAQPTQERFFPEDLRRGFLQGVVSGARREPTIRGQVLELDAVEAASDGGIRRATYSVLEDDVAAVALFARR